MSNYAKADTRAQWFADNYRGSSMDPNCGVIHTTEGADWPGYEGGATAPNYTAKPDFANQRLIWRAHYPDEMSSRALRNLSGGVETNTANAVQVELIGTCDPRAHASWKTQHIYWPEAPEWALRDLAEFVADMHRRHGIKIQGPSTWRPYPASYGATDSRLTFSEWRGFYGWCGHQHVPENSHGDPGSLDWSAVERMAKALVTPEPPKPPKTPQRKSFVAKVGTANFGNASDAKVVDDLDLERREVRILGGQEGGDRGDAVRDFLRSHPRWDAYFGDRPGSASVPILFRADKYDVIHSEAHLLVPSRLVVPKGVKKKGAGPARIKPKVGNHLTLRDKETGGVLDVINHHLIASATRSDMSPAETRLRREHFADHIAALLKVCREIDGPVVTTADWNATRDFGPMKALEAAGFTGWTTEGTHGRRPIDHVLGRDFAQLEQEVFDNSSDHDFVAVRGRTQP